MKTDLNSLKRELSRLADVDYLKKELARITSEIKKFDVHISLTPHARQRLAKLEKRVRELLKMIAQLQKQVDSSFAKFVKAVRTRKASVGQATKKKTSRKTTRKAATRKSAK